MKRLQCSLEILGGLRNRNHYNMAMQDSGSIISLFHALGLFLFKNPLVARPLFSIVPTDQEPGTGYSIIQDVALFRNKPSYQIMTKDK